MKDDTKMTIAANNIMFNSPDEAMPDIVAGIQVYANIKKATIDIPFLTKLQFVTRAGVTKTWCVGDNLHFPWCSVNPCGLRLGFWFSNFSDR